MLWGNTTNIEAKTAKNSYFLGFFADLAGSEERRLVKRPQFPAVDAFQRGGAEQFHRADSDHQVAPDLGFIEIRCHAGQLEFAVQRFVGDTEQRAVGHPEPEPVRRDGRAFHVERDRARLTEKTGLCSYLQSFLRFPHLSLYQWI